MLDQNPNFHLKLDECQQERIAANNLSLQRSLLAIPLAKIISQQNCDNITERLSQGLLTSYLWYTDKQDGQLARSSVSKAEALIRDYPEQNDNELLQTLLDSTTKDFGAKIDQESDKTFSNNIIYGLMNRAINNGDIKSFLLLNIHMKSTFLRDSKMRAIRELGASKNIDVSAGKYGKIKTAVQAAGSILSIISKPNTRVNSIGVYLINWSNIPSWIAYYKMRRKIMNTNLT